MEIFRIQYFNCINSMKHRVFKTSLGEGGVSFWTVVILFNKNMFKSKHCKIEQPQWSI